MIITDGQGNRIANTKFGNFMNYFSYERMESVNIRFLLDSSREEFYLAKESALSIINCKKETE